MSRQTTAAVLALLAAWAAPAAEPVPARGDGRPPAGLVRSLRELEGVQMLEAIVTGSKMGPGSGWFKPSESRYDWHWLAACYDADKDGRVTAAEFKGPPEW